MVQENIKSFYAPSPMSDVELVVEDKHFYLNKGVFKLFLILL